MGNHSLPKIAPSSLHDLAIPVEINNITTNKVNNKNNSKTLLKPNLNKNHITIDAKEKISKSGIYQTENQNKTIPIDNTFQKLNLFEEKKRNFKINGKSFSTITLKKFKYKYNARTNTLSNLSTLNNLTENKKKIF